VPATAAMARQPGEDPHEKEKLLGSHLEHAEEPESMDGPGDAPGVGGGAPGPADDASAATEGKDEPGAANEARREERASSTELSPSARLKSVPSVSKDDLGLCETHPCLLQATVVLPAAGEPRGTVRNSATAPQPVGLPSAGRICLEEDRMSNLEEPCGCSG
jgi:hypothetical protein